MSSVWVLWRFGMGSKGVQFTIRLDEKINGEIVDRAKEMGVTRAELIRVGLEMYLRTQTGSNPDSEGTQTSSDPNPKAEALLIEHQQKELAEKNEQINELLRQQDQNQQIIMSMNQNQQKLLVESKRTWFQRLFGLNETEA